MTSLKIVLCLMVAGAALSCDLYTQYEDGGGRCCKKCGPGTRMSEPRSNCLDPLCKPCADDEYQHEYTEATKCIPQPYCDPNKDFVTASPVSKERKSVCTCKDGYHCSSEACITCMAHSHCAPGQRVQVKGTHALDTVCEVCPPNTFSTQELADNCQNWTVCKLGRKTLGTATSDTVCEEMNRHIIWIIPVTIALVLFLVLVLFTFWNCRGKALNAKEKHQVAETKTWAEPTAEETLTFPEENEEHWTAPVTDRGNVMAQAQEKAPGSLLSFA